LLAKSFASSLATDSGDTGGWCWCW